MVRIVKAADQCLSLHHGATFGCGIAIICLLLYCLIYYPALSSIPSVAGAFAFWLVMAMFDMTTVCLSGILVNSAVSVTVPKPAVNRTQSKKHIITRFNRLSKHRLSAIGTRCGVGDLDT